MSQKRILVHSEQQFTRRIVVTQRGDTYGVVYTPPGEPTRSLHASGAAAERLTQAVNQNKAEGADTPDAWYKAVLEHAA